MGESVRRHVRRFLHLCLRALAGSAGFLIPDPAHPLGDQPPRLPPGHPERLVPDVPPSDEEKLLWAQLAGAHSPRR